MSKKGIEFCAYITYKTETWRDQKKLNRAVMSNQVKTIANSLNKEKLRARKFHC